MQILVKNHAGKKINCERNATKWIASKYLDVPAKQKNNLEQLQEIKKRKLLKICFFL